MVPVHSVAGSMYYVPWYREVSFNPDEMTHRVKHHKNDREPRPSVRSKPDSIQRMNCDMKSMGNEDRAEAHPSSESVPRARYFDIRDLAREVERAEKRCEISQCRLEQRKRQLQIDRELGDRSLAALLAVLISASAGAVFVIATITLFSDEDSGHPKVGLVFLFVSGVTACILLSVVQSRWAQTTSDSKQITSVSAPSPLLAGGLTAGAVYFCSRDNLLGLWSGLWVFSSLQRTPGPQSVSSTAASGTQSKKLIAQEKSASTKPNGVAAGAHHAVIATTLLLEFRTIPFFAICSLCAVVSVNSKEAFNNALASMLTELTAFRWKRQDIRPK